MHLPRAMLSLAFVLSLAFAVLTAAGIEPEPEKPDKPEPATLPSRILGGERGGPSQGINPPKVRWVGQMPRATGRKLVAGYAVYAIQINKSCDAVRRNLFVVGIEVLLLGQA